MRTVDYVDILDRLLAPVRHKVSTLIVAAISFSVAATYVVGKQAEFAVDGLIEVARPRWESNVTSYIDPTDVLTFLNFTYAKKVAGVAEAPFIKSANWIKPGTNLLRVRIHAKSVEDARAEISKVVSALNEKFLDQLNLNLKPQLERIISLENRQLSITKEVELLKHIDTQKPSESTRILTALQRLELGREADAILIDLSTAKKELPSTGEFVARLMDRNVPSLSPVVPDVVSALASAGILTVIFSLIAAAALDGVQTYSQKNLNEDTGR